jgi:hypothetical protein
MRARIAAARWWIGIGAALITSVFFYSTLLFSGPLDHRDWSGHHFHYFDWVRVSMVRHHTLPLYMADAKMTKNFIANAEAPTLGPFIWLLPLLGTDAYIKFLIVLFTAAGCVGMFALLRNFEVDPLVALVIAPAFAFNGFFFSHLVAGHHWVMGCQLLPWLVLLLRRAASGSKRAVWWAAAIGAFTILGGQHQPFIWQNLVLCGYALLLALGRQSLRPLRSLLAILAWTAGLGAVKLLPMLFEFSDYHPAAHTIGIPMPMLLTAFVGRGQGPETQLSGLEFTSGAGWWEYAFYFGPIVFVCLAAGALSLRRTWPFAVIGGFFALIAVDATNGFDFWARLTDLPIWRTQRSPSRFLFVASFGLLVAGGVGLQRIHRWAHPRSPRIVGVLAFGLAALTLLDLRAESQRWQSAAVGREPASLTHHPRRTELRGGPVAVATLHEFAPNRIVYRVVATEDARVVLPVRYAKGARARQRRGEDPGAAEWQVDGFPAASDDGKLAIDVPAGESDVAIRYRPRWLGAGIATSAVSLLALGLLVHRDRRRATGDPAPN